MKKLIVISMLLAIAAAPALLAEDGAAIYKTKCASCHGPDGAGQTTMGKKFGLKDLGSADVQKLKDEELTKIVADGKGKMPAYKGKLTDAQIQALVTFMRTLKK